MTDTAETMEEHVMAALFRELRPDDEVRRYAVGDIVGDEITYIDFGPVNVRDLARAATAAMAEPTDAMVERYPEPSLAGIMTDQSVLERYRAWALNEARVAYEKARQAALTEQPE